MDNHKDFWQRPVTDAVSVELTPGRRPTLLIKEDGRPILVLELLEARALIEVLNVAVGELFILRRDPAALARVRRLLESDATLANGGSDRRSASAKSKSIGQVKAQELIRRYKSGERSFPSVDLRYADLEGADLSEVDLNGADLTGANLKLAKLFGANLEEANLSQANLEGAGLYQADLSGADLSKANLRRAFLGNANLEDAQVADEQLAQTTALNGAVLPDGTKRG